MLEAIHVVEWFKLFFSIFVFLGPGFALVIVLNKEFVKSPLHLFVLSLASSVALWAILLAWLKFIGFRINTSFVWIFFLLGWIIGIVYLKFHWKSVALNHYSLTISHISLFLFTAIIGLLVAWGIRHNVAGSGSDSYHHTLISQLIYNNGGLPNNYQPANDEVISFSYHYGYHATMAALMWLSGWGSRLMVLASGPLLIMFVALGIGLFTEELTNQPSAGTIAGIFTGLICVFPVYFLNWGRYSQLAALAVVPVFFSLIVNYYNEYSSHIDTGKIAYLAFLATGITLLHYRVTIMVAIAVITSLFFIKNDNIYNLKKNIKFLIPMTIAVILALFFISPWLWLVYESHKFGFSFHLAEPNATYYSIQRLGVDVLEYPTNKIVLVIISAGLVFGFYKQKWFVHWLTIWTCVMILVSGPKFLSSSMDTISVVISLFVPAAIITGWFINELINKFSHRFRSSLIFLMLVFLVWSGSAVPNKNLTGQSFVTLEDLGAAEWIKANVPPNAYFMVNTYQFGFSDNFVIGIDAGYWLPLLAQRRVVTLPMVSDIERFKDQNGNQNLLDLNNLHGELTTSEAISLMSNLGITHVYIGQRQGPIKKDRLLSSDHYKLIYSDDGVSIFEFLKSN